MMNPSTLKSLLNHLPATPRPLPLRSDFDLNPHVPLPSALRPAAVLVPLLVRPSGVNVVLTLRQPHLSQHAGQVSFPGGRVDPEDKDEAAAALREAWEEVGLPPEAVEPLGWLDPHVTVTGYRVAPLVGIIHAPVVWNPEPNEVAEIFEVPIQFFLNPQNLSIGTHAAKNGDTWRYYRYNHQIYDVWGATAAMLVNLADHLNQSITSESARYEA